MKLRVADRAQILRKLAALGAKPATARMHEMNTLFDTAEGALARRGRIVRIRVVTVARGARVRGGEPDVVLTYKGPAQGAGRTKYKIREEREVRVAGGAEALTRILGALGLAPWYRYEKYRRAYRLARVPGLVVDFDETPLGDFLELEGTQEQIDRAAKLMGYGEADYIVKSYGGLHMESLGIGPRRRRCSQNEPTPRTKPPDMLFSRKK